MGRPSETQRSMYCAVETVVESVVESGIETIFVI